MVLSKVTKHAEAAGVLDHDAFRIALNERLASGELAKPGGPTYAVVYFNIENFKHYNQRYGHAAGDVFLRNMAASITHNFPGDMIGHNAADQFVVLTLLQNVEPNVCAVRADFRRDHKDSSIWMHAGYCVIDKRDSSAGIVCDRAKLACDELRGRRDTYLREYDAALQHEILWRRYVLDHFFEALEKGWIRAYCQPIVRAATGETCDVEVLARWIDPTEGVVPPAEFVPVLEEARLINHLDLAVLRDACRACRQLEDAGRGYISLSVNLSRLDFELCDIVSEVETVLSEYGIPHDRAAIEVTESALAGNQEFLRVEVDRFRAHGFQVWMDDFGSGYSSLNVLKDYTFDLVKIDMAFLRGFEDDASNTRIMLAKVIDLVKELGIKTLVEGVETQEQYDFLRSLGCGRVQGYLFGMPAPLPDSTEGIANDMHPRVERRAAHDFYEEVGRVNLMRPDPHPSVTGHYLPSDVAACIIRRRAGVFEYLNTNDLYEKFLAETDATFNPVCVATIDRCVQTGRWERYFEGNYVVRVRPISLAPEIDAVALLAIAES